MLEGLVVAATVLFFIFDPFASLPIFLSMTNGQNDDQMTSSANRAIMVAGILFVVFAVLGQQILDIFSITTNGFRIAGGIVLLMMSVEVVFGLELTKQKKEDVAWVIIATPVLTGPGVISTAILLVSLYDIPTVLFAGVFALLVTWILLRNAVYIVKMVGQTAIDVFSRIIGMIIAALAVEYIMSGAIEYVNDYVPAVMSFLVLH